MVRQRAKFIDKFFFAVNGRAEKKRPFNERLSGRQRQSTSSWIRMAAVVSPFPLPVKTCTYPLTIFLAFTLTDADLKL
jgi:hypothetical protein